MTAYFREDVPITVQPSVLTYNNIASVCALSTIPRVSYDSETGINSYWGCNDWVINRLRTIFVNMQKENYNERVLKVEVYPIIYQVSEEERSSMRSVRELEDKYYLSGSLLVFKSYKSTKDDVSISKMSEIDIVDKCIAIEYSIFLEQTIDGNPYTVQELATMMIATALNQYRRIEFVPHEKLQIDIITPDSTLDMISHSEDATDWSRKNDFIFFVENNLSAAYDEESACILTKVNPYKVRLSDGKKTSIITFGFRNDLTESAEERNFPVSYKEVRSAYYKSFDINRYRML